jgi:hypothetical protein
LISKALGILRGIGSELLSFLHWVLVGVLANIGQNSFSISVLFVPFIDVVIGRLILKPFQNGLVFHCDFQ